MGQINRLKVFQPGKKALSADMNAELDNLLNAHNDNDTTLTNLLNTLQSIVDSNSGADFVKATSIPELTGSTVQTILESLKALDDSNREYLLSQIQGVTLGQIPDGTITQEKLAFQIASDATSVSITDTGNYYTSTNAEGALQEIGQTLNSMRGNLVASTNNILGS